MLGTKDQHFLKFKTRKRNGISNRKAENGSWLNARNKWKEKLKSHEKKN